MKPIWAIAEFVVTREVLRDRLGAPHCVETDSLRTMGGEEDIWAFETGSGEHIGLLLRVPYKLAVVFSDRPSTEAALAELGSVVDRASLRIISPPAQF